MSYSVVQSMRRPAAFSVEPLQMYALLHVYLVVHRLSTKHRGCAMCREPWPCVKVRQAARLRDGF